MSHCANESSYPPKPSAERSMSFRSIFMVLFSYPLIKTKPFSKFILAEIKKIINELANAGATEEELERVKNLKLSAIEYANEANADIAETNGTFVHLFENFVSAKERKQKVSSVTLDEVNKFAKKIADETTFNIVAVGKNIDIKDLKQF